MHFGWFDYAHHKFAQYKQKGFAHFLLIFFGLILLVGGFFYFKLNQARYPQIPKPQPSSSPVATQSKYTNSSLGLEFSYPNGLAVKEDSEEQFNKRGGGDFRKNFKGYIGYEPGKFLGAVAVLGTDGDFDKATFTVWVFDNPKSLPIDSWFRDYWYYPFLWGDYTDNGRVKIAPNAQATVSGQLAKSTIVSYQPGSPKFIYLAGSGKMFLFRVLAGGDQILNSFKLF